MPSFDIVRHSDVPDSYRVLRVLSDFDMSQTVRARRMAKI